MEGATEVMREHAAVSQLVKRTVIAERHRVELLSACIRGRVAA